MPRYDYRCPRCDAEALDVDRSIPKRDDGPECDCGERMKRMPPSRVSFSLLGSGWEKDGYGG